MLVDVALYPFSDPVLEVIAGESSVPRKISSGVYLCKHYSFNYCFDSNNWERYFDIADDLYSYGVCDDIEQFFSHKIGHIIKESDEKFVTSFTHISKKNQPDSGGWRWHKWGPYIGVGTPNKEYLFDEEGFENGVYVYHVFKRV